jgi:tyrosyl-tRNA synthetase
MYGKLMSISDELMWKYWTLLTDLRQSEVDAMQAEVAAGTLHPMAAKKRLARTITAGFHGEQAAASADENWARMFQEKEFSDVVEEVQLDLSSYVPEHQIKMVQAIRGMDITGMELPSTISFLIKISKVLVDCGLATSNTEAQRKLREGAVRINGDVYRDTAFLLIADLFTPSTSGRPNAGLQIRLGKRAKLVFLS